METRTLKTAGDLTLTYYVSGSAGDRIVLVNAPGMSVELWSWIVRALRGHYTVLAFDYRGFPDAEKELMALRETAKKIPATANLFTTPVSVALKVGDGGDARMWSPLA